MVFYIVGALVALWIVAAASRRMSARKKAVRVVEGRCAGCGRCLKRCRHGVFELLSDEGGVRVVVKNIDRCTACGNCVSCCRFKALEMSDIYPPGR
ncbi:MAG: 4Fe-4S dicluster domain-containing protein [Tannerellaceae bacterium]|nr:4Fe-4S dicluster domain-containing protein [Tannerellaceae bacterium]